MEFAGIYKNGVMYPLDNIQAEEMALHIPEGVPIVFEIHEKRSAGNHARYFKFRNVAFNMQNYYQNKEIFRKYIQMRAGHYETVITHKGRILYFPMSVKWSQLSETKFRVLFKDCITAFLDFYNEVSPVQMTEDEFRNIVDFD